MTRSTAALVRRFPFMRPAEGPTRELYNRLSHVEFRWRLRCLQRRLEGDAAPVRTKPLPKHGPGSYRILLPPKLAREARFVHRYTHEPGFWSLVETRTNPRLDQPLGRQRRGRQHARRRQAYLELWLRLLVQGYITQSQANDGPLTGKTIRSLLKRSDWNYHILDFGKPATRKLADADLRTRAKVPFAIKPVTPEEKQTFVRARFDLSDEGEPAASAQRTLMDHWQREPWSMDPVYVESLLAFQAASKDFLRSQHWRGDDDTRRRRLLDDFSVAWWVLPRLHTYSAIDVALDWWASLEPKSQNRWLQRPARRALTPHRAGQVATAMLRRRGRHVKAFTRSAATIQFLTAGIRYAANKDSRSATTAFQTAIQLAPDRLLSKLAEYDSQSLQKKPPGDWGVHWWHDTEIPVRRALSAFHFPATKEWPRWLGPQNVSTIAMMEWEIIR